MLGTGMITARSLGLAVVLLGCAGKSEEGEDSENVAPSHSNAEVALEVENHGWADIVIYLVRGSSAERLGMVGSLNTQTFVFPYRRIGGNDVRLRADPIGDLSTFTSEILRLQPGQWVKWTLENDLTRSFLAVY